MSDSLAEVPEISVTDYFAKADDYLLIDVRRPEEWAGELGHAAKAVLVELGPDLQDYIDQLDPKGRYAIICRSGARSGHVTAVMREQGFTDVYNVAGGMLAWQQAGLPVASADS